MIPLPDFTDDGMRQVLRREHRLTGDELALLEEYDERVHVEMLVDTIARAERMANACPVPDDLPTIALSLYSTLPGVWPPWTTEGGANKYTEMCMAPPEQRRWDAWLTGDDVGSRRYLCGYAYNCPRCSWRASLPTLQNLHEKIRAYPSVWIGLATGSRKKVDRAFEGRRDRIRKATMVPNLYPVLYAACWREDVGLSSESLEGQELGKEPHIADDWSRVVVVSPIHDLGGHGWVGAWIKPQTAIVIMAHQMRFRFPSRYDWTSSMVDGHRWVPKVRATVKPKKGTPAEPPIKLGSAMTYPHIEAVNAQLRGLLADKYEPGEVIPGTGVFRKPRKMPPKDFAKLWATISTDLRSGEGEEQEGNDADT